MNTDSKFARIKRTRVQHFSFECTPTPRIRSHFQSKLKQKNSIRLWATSVWYPADKRKTNGESPTSFVDPEQKIGRRQSRGEIVLNFGAIRKRFGTMRCMYLLPRSEHPLSTGPTCSERGFRTRLCGFSFRVRTTQPTIRTRRVVDERRYRRPGSR